MTIAELMFEEFFTRPIPHQGFVIDAARPAIIGLIEPSANDRPELHGYIVTMEGNVVLPELRPTSEESHEGEPSTDPETNRRPTNNT